MEKINMEQKQKAKILKNFLGFFYTQVNAQEIQTFKNSYPKIQSMYIEGNQEYLKKLGCFLILYFDLKDFKHYNCYELFERYIGKNSDDYSWIDLKSKVVFLHYPEFTTDNRKMEELISHIISHRKMHSLVSIVITEKKLSFVENSFKHMFSYVEPKVSTVIKKEVKEIKKTNFKLKTSTSNSEIDDLM